MQRRRFVHNHERDIAPSLLPLADVLFFFSLQNKKTGEYDNAWARVAATLKTNANKEATWDGKLLGTKAGVAMAPTLANVNIA